MEDEQTLGLQFQKKIKELQVGGVWDFSFTCGSLTVGWVLCAINHLEQVNSSMGLPASVVSFLLG